MPVAILLSVTRSSRDQRHTLIRRDLDASAHSQLLGQPSQEGHPRSAAKREAYADTSFMTVPTGAAAVDGLLRLFAVWQDPDHLDLDWRNSDLYCPTSS